jgi:succinate dehydrogenase/fumarate reductase flavoprotein subunit
VIVAGAGMAGLVCAARARELGLAPRVLEKGPRAGGSMLLSSCVIWRHRDFDDFRAECPDGDEPLQRLVWERLDDALAWLVSLGAEPMWQDTENPRTTGKRFDPRALTRLLAGDVELETPLPEDAEPPLVLATGGFGKRLAEARGLLLRANPWSDGAGFDYATARGAGVTGGLDEFYGRAMPAPPARWGESEFVDHAQVYGRFATVLDEHETEIPWKADDWSENGLVQTIAKRGGRAWYVVDRGDLGRETPYGTIAKCIDRVRAAGGTVEDRDGAVAVHVVAAVTHTIGGLAIDDRTHVLDANGSPIPGLYAVGVDAGGWSTGGYASGLAAALVLGLVAAETIAT